MNADNEMPGRRNRRRRRARGGHPVDGPEQTAAGCGRGASRSEQDRRDEAGAHEDRDPAPLEPAEVHALREALDDEHKAWATYDQVVRDFGPVQPFVNIREAEARHIDALLSLFRRYALPAPDNPWPGRVPRFASLHEACAAGVDAEVENGALYERLLRSSDRPDVLAVFRNLQRASQQNHLQAFRRCRDRERRRGSS